MMDSYNFNIFPEHSAANNHHAHNQNNEYYQFNGQYPGGYNNYNQQWNHQSPPMSFAAAHYPHVPQAQMQPVMAGPTSLHVSPHNSPQNQVERSPQHTLPQQSSPPHMLHTSPQHMLQSSPQHMNGGSQPHSLSSSPVANHIHGSPHNSVAMSPQNGQILNYSSMQSSPESVIMQQAHNSPPHSIQHSPPYQMNEPVVPAINLAQVPPQNAYPVHAAAAYAIHPQPSTSRGITGPPRHYLPAPYPRQALEQMHNAVSRHTMRQAQQRFFSNPGPSLALYHQAMTVPPVGQYAMQSNQQQQQQVQAPSATVLSSSPDTPPRSSPDEPTQFSGRGSGNDRTPYEWLNRSNHQNGRNPGKTRTKDKYRVVYSDEQRMALEREYNFTSRYITIKRKTELSEILNLSQRQVKIWFQNRRAKDRKLSKKQNEERNQLEMFAASQQVIPANPAEQPPAVSAAVPGVRLPQSAMNPPSAAMSHPPVPMSHPPVTMSHPPVTMSHPPVTANHPPMPLYQDVIPVEYMQRVLQNMNVQMKPENTNDNSN